MVNLSRSFRILANSLTLIRVFIAIPIIVSLIGRGYLLAWILFSLAGLSDLLDGYFARISNTSSIWGARYDPLADKLAILVPTLWLCQEGIIPFWSIIKSRG